MSSQIVAFSPWGEQRRRELRFFAEHLLHEVPRRTLFQRAPRRSDRVFELVIPNNVEEEEGVFIEWDEDKKIHIFGEWAIAGWTLSGYIGMSYARYEPKHIANVIRKKPAEGHYKCPSCPEGKTFSNYTSLASHMAQKHELNVNEYVCKCGFYTQYTRTMKQHKCSKTHFVKAYKLRSEKFEISVSVDKSWRRLVKRPLTGDFEFLNDMPLNADGEALREKIREGKNLTSKERKWVKMLRMSRYREMPYTQGQRGLIEALKREFKHTMSQKGIDGIALDLGEHLSTAIMAWEACRTWTGVCATVVHYCCKFLNVTKVVAKGVASLIYGLMKKLSLVVEEADLPVTQGATSLTEFTLDMLNTIVDAFLKYCGLALSFPPRLLYGFHMGVINAKDAIAAKEILTTHLPELFENIHCWIKGVPTRATQCKESVDEIYKRYLDIRNVPVQERDSDWASRVYDANVWCDTYETLLSEINTRSSWYMKIAARDVSYKVKHLREMKTVADSLMLGANKRVEPVGILFYGEGGLLKSVLMKKLANQFIASDLGYEPGTKVDEEKLGFYTWSRTKGSERMDGIQPFHKVLFYDDLVTEKDEATRGAELSELLPICTSLPYCANVAQLEGKGNIFIKPDLVLLSMNERVHQTSHLGLTDNKAFLRRFIVVEVVPREGETVKIAKQRARNTTVVNMSDFDAIVRYKLLSQMGEDEGRFVTASELLSITVGEIQKRRDVFSKQRVYTVEASTGNRLGGTPKTQASELERVFGSVDIFKEFMAMSDNVGPEYADVYRDMLTLLAADGELTLKDGYLWVRELKLPLPSEAFVFSGTPKYVCSDAYKFVGVPSMKGTIAFGFACLCPQVLYRQIDKNYFIGKYYCDVLDGEAFDVAPEDVPDYMWEDADFAGEQAPVEEKPKVTVIDTPLIDEPSWWESFTHKREGFEWVTNTSVAIMGASQTTKGIMSVLISIVIATMSPLYGVIFLLLGPVIMSPVSVFEWALGAVVAYAFNVRTKQSRVAMQVALGAFGTLAATYGVYWIAMRLMKPTAQSMRTKESIEAPKAAQKAHGATFQGVDMQKDATLEQHMDSVFEKNQFIAIADDGTRIQLLGFARDLFLTTTHEWAQACTSDKLRVIRTGFREEVHITNISKFNITPKGGLVPEAVILKIKGLQVKDIVNKFRLSTDYRSEYYQCYVAKTSMNAKETVLTKTHIPIDTVTYDDVSQCEIADSLQGKITIRGYLIGHGNTMSGDCTCPWYVLDARCPRKIAGIHVAGNRGTGHAYCSVIFQEWLQDAKAFFGYVHSDDSHLTDLPSTQGFPNTLPLGIIKPKFQSSKMPPKTKLARSGMHFNGAFSPCLDLLWKNAKGDTEFQHEYYLSELRRYHEKFARIPKCPLDFKEICLLQSGEICDIASKLRSPLAQIPEVLNGNPEYGTTSINLKGAKGFPEDRLFPGRGKSPIIYKDDDDIIKCSEIYQVILEQSLDNIFSKNGGTMNYARVSFKDELGIKQRLFFAGNVPHYVAGDMVLGRFFAVCRKLRWFGPGTALNTIESHYIVMYLLSNDPDLMRVIMLDISGMDLSESYEALHTIHEFIIHCIDLVHDDEDWKEKCSAWCEASLEQVWIFMQHAFLVRGRMASGQRFTAEINTFLLHFALLHAFVTGWMANNEGTFEEAQEAWKEDIRDVEYGDDSLITVRSGTHLWFTPSFIVSHMAINFGMKFTSAVKDSEVGFCTFEQAQFLKRKFIVVEDHWHAVLPIKNILGTLEWYNVSSGSKVDAVKSKVQSALDELGLYPEDIYNKHKKMIARQCAKNGYPIVDIPYAAMRRRYLTG